MLLTQSATSAIKCVPDATMEALVRQAIARGKGTIDLSALQSRRSCSGKSAETVLQEIRRAEYMARGARAGQSVRPVQSRLAPPAAPAQPRPPDPNQAALNAVLNEILTIDSQSWRINRYHPGSARDARGLALEDGKYQISGNYTFTGIGRPSRGRLTAILKGNRVHCLEFFDQPEVCRPVGHSITAQFSAAVQQTADQARAAAAARPKRAGQCRPAEIIRFCPPADTGMDAPGARICGGNCAFESYSNFDYKVYCNSETGVFYGSQREAEAKACR